MSREVLVQQPSRQFTDAVYALTEPRPVWFDGTCRWIDATYTRLRESLTTRTARAAAAAGSRPPLRVDVLNLLCDMDTTVAAWWPDANNTTDRLKKMTEHQWTPEDVRKLDGYTNQVQAWTTSAAELLGDRAVSVPLRKPCPRCNALWHHSGSENVRAYALRASEDGASCLACKSTWPTDQFGLLARLLGVTTNEGIAHARRPLHHTT